MNSEDLKPKQVRQLSQVLARHLQFYMRLVKRIERLKWPPTDHVYVRAMRARDSVSALKTFVEQIGKDQPEPPSTPGAGWYLDAQETAPGRRRGRVV
ncbi:MAG TPA: hypothetical protein VF669_11355 [Tepidisphaeraceae bacterium]